MTDLLIRLFCGKRQRSEDETRKKCGSAAGAVGITVNLMLSALKLTFGILSGSVAITADAMNNISDAASSIITLITFRISEKPADRAHPFGHQRLEYVASMIVSFIIVVVGAETLINSVKVLLGIGEHEAPDFGLITIVILVVSVIMKMLLGFFYRNLGKKIKSEVLRASAMDSFSDCLSTFAVLICSIIIRFTGFRLLDAIVGTAVSCLIIFGGIKLLNETKNSILGEAPLDDVVEKIKAVIARHPEALGVHDLIIHNYGPTHLIASLHVEVDGSQDIYLLHEEIDRMEKEIQDELHIFCTIHMDPIVVNDPRVNELRVFLTDVLHDTLPDVAFHDFRTVIGKSRTIMIFDIVLPYESRFTPDEIKKKISDAVAERRPDITCVITVDRG